nr:replicative DNA helicase [Lachnospiraceae bacterium]
MEDTLIRRTMPNSIEAEQSVVGSMLMDQDAVITASEILTKEDFYYRQYGILFDAMVQLFKENEPIDLVTIQARLRQMDMPEELVALEYIKELLDTVPYSTNIATYAKMVKEKALLRELIHASEGIASDCYEGKLSMGEVFEKTEKEIFDLVQSRNAGGEFTPISTIVINALNKIQKASLTSGAVTGIATGFTDLDMMLSGLQPSDFILVAARPSMGKTAFVLNIAEYVAIRNKIPTVIFSLEMSKESLVNRLLSLESRVDAQNIRSGKLSDVEWGSLLEGADAVGESALTIDDTPGISVNDLRSKCRKLKMENKLSLIIIDYIGLMSSSSGRKSDSRQ